MNACTICFLATCSDFAHICWSRTSILSRLFLSLVVLWLALQSLRFDVFLLLLILSVAYQVLLPDSITFLVHRCLFLSVLRFTFQPRPGCHSKSFSDFLNLWFKLQATLESFQNTRSIMDVIDWLLIGFRLQQNFPQDHELL